MIIGCKRKISEQEILDEIERIKDGCGQYIGVPIFVKFRPCGETYKGNHYFCENCKARLSLWTTYL